MTPPASASPPAAGSVCEQRWFRLVCLGAAAGLAVLLWSAVCTAPAVPWNLVRLSPSFALARGLTIYPPAGSGAQLGWFYGPFFPLWYLPIGFMTQPTWALLLAAGWNLVTLGAPLALLLRTAGLRGRVLAAALVLAGVAFGSNDATRYALFFIHVDALCVACGFVACACLLRAARGGGTAALHGAALALVLAIWTKQIAVMLAPGLLCWLWQEKRSDLAARLFFWGVTYGALVTLAIFAWFGPQEVLFNVVYVQMRDPWNGGFAKIAAEAAGFIGTLWTWLPACFALALALRASRSMPASARAAIRLLLWAALWQLPLGLTALVKPGGGFNSVHSVWYVAAAGLVAIGCALTQPAPRWPGRLAWAAAFLVPVASLPSALDQFGARFTPDRSQEGLLATARANPHRLYLPWNPLITLITDRRVYPSDDALLCLWRCGLPVSIEQVRAALPPEPVILYQEPSQSEFALRYFPRVKARRTGETPPPQPAAPAKAP